MNFFTQRDKQLHILTNIFGVIMWQFVMPLSCAIQLQILIGIGKEIYDYYHPLTHTCDVWDIVADVIGTYLGVTLVLLFIHFWK
jgi:hypothetical protein